MTFGGLTAVSSYAYCHEWLRTYDATHSKVRKESYPERAEDKRGKIFHSFRGMRGLQEGNATHTKGGRAEKLFFIFVFSVVLRPLIPSSSF
jgi:hypothetical protein